jgi:septal ring factor EnvC (AmiA/AmiB activator)
MQLYYEQLGEHMAMHERECAAMKHNQAETMKLKQRISADAKKHDKLNLQLDIKNAQIRSVKVEIEQLQDRNTHLTQKMARSRVYAESRTAQAEQEKKGRIQAEKRLEEILDAHKKITAMYSGPGK